MSKAGDPWRQTPGRPAESPQGRVAPRRWRPTRGRRLAEVGRAAGATCGPMPEARAASRPRTGVRMKRGSQFGNTARAAGVAKRKGMDPRLDGEIDDDRAAGRDGAELLREAVRETEPLGAFDARAIRELYKAAPADPKGLRRTIRRSELRQIVPLADSTIYELERRGEFPAAVLPHRALRGVGSGRSAGLDPEPAAGGSNG